jgi:hypothetical protein
MQTSPSTFSCDLGAARSRLPNSKPATGAHVRFFPFAAKVCSGHRYVPRRTVFESWIAFGQLWPFPLGHSSRPRCWGHVNFETTEEELSRLRKKQRQTRHDEVFGGLSREERQEYDGNELRIRELHRRLSAAGKSFRILIR